MLVVGAPAALGRDIRDPAQPGARGCRLRGRRRPRPIPSAIEAVAIVLVIAASAGPVWAPGALSSRGLVIRYARGVGGLLRRAHRDDATAWMRRLEEELLVDQVTRCYEHSLWQRKLAAAGVRPGTC